MLNVKVSHNISGTLVLCLPEQTRSKFAEGAVVNYDSTQNLLFVRPSDPKAKGKKVRPGREENGTYGMSFRDQSVGRSDQLPRFRLVEAKADEDGSKLIIHLPDRDKLPGAISRRSPSAKSPATTPVLRSQIGEAISIINRFMDENPSAHVDIEDRRVVITVQEVFR